MAPQSEEAKKPSLLLPILAGVFTLIGTLVGGAALLWMFAARPASTSFTPRGEVVTYTRLPDEETAEERALAANSADPVWHDDAKYSSWAPDGPAATSVPADPAAIVRSSTSD